MSAWPSPARGQVLGQAYQNLGSRKGMTSQATPRICEFGDTTVSFSRVLGEPHALRSCLLGVLSLWQLPRQQEQRDALLSVGRTSAACQRMSTFLFFLAWTFWPRNRSSSGKHVWLRERGKPRRRRHWELVSHLSTAQGAMRLRNGKMKFLAEAGR